MLLAAVRKEKKEIFTQGKLERTQEIAKSMLTKGLSIELIMEITQLSKEEIEQLRNQAIR